jgi:hypothetical protein
MTLAKRKTRTKAQLDYHDRAAALGCVVCIKRGCSQPNETHLHHRNFNDWHGAKQLGQDAVVAMCAWHHDGRLIEGWNSEGMRRTFGPSFKHAADFREWTYDVLPGYGRGTEAWQKYQDELLEEK